MAKTKQIASIQYPGYRIVIIRHYDQKINPFYIVKKWEGYNEKKLLARAFPNSGKIRQLAQLPSLSAATTGY